MIEFLTLILFLFFILGLMFGPVRAKPTELDSPLFTTIKPHYKPKPAPVVKTIDLDMIRDGAIMSCDLYKDSVDILIKLGNKPVEAKSRVLKHIRNGNWTIQDILKADSK